MALPTLEKTWEFRNNIPLIGTTNSGVSHGRLAMLIKNVLTDTLVGSHVYNESDIVEVSAGVTYAIDPTNAADSTMYDPAKIGALAGKTVKVRGASNGGNNGNFTVTGQVDIGGGIYRLEYGNASGVAEASFAGSAKVLRGDFTSPWQIDHCGFLADVGTTDDEVDRLATNLMNRSSGSNDYWVVKNPVTGTRWQLSLDTTNGSQEGSYGSFRTCVTPYEFAPRVGANGSAVGSVTLTQPDGSTTTSERTYINDTYWFNGQPEGNGAWNALVNLQISTDGYHTRLFVAYNGYYPLFWCDEGVKDPIAEWTTAQATLMVRAAATADCAGYSNFNDNANFTGTKMDSGPTLNLGTYYNPWFYGSTEGYVAAAIGQNLTTPNELSGAEQFFRIGLLTATPTVRGRHGQLKDMFFVRDNLIRGTTFPDSAAREWILIGDIAVPWDGSIPQTTL